MQSLLAVQPVAYIQSLLSADIASVTDIVFPIERELAETKLEFLLTIALSTGKLSIDMPSESSSITQKVVNDLIILINFNMC